MKAVVILGPTASGKTELSLNMADNIFEIISADSVQVYRYMDIGSSKPSQSEMKIVRHHLIDIVNPDYRFTVGDFCNRASVVSTEIIKRNKIPLVVGGTGFYINSLFVGIDQIPDINGDVIAEVTDEYDNGYAISLYEELRRFDPDFALKVHVNDRQRIIRGISVFRGTGRSISSYFTDRKKDNIFNVLYLGLSIDKDFLFKRIDTRVDLMVKKGFVEEVNSLRNMGYDPVLNSLQSIGYAEINRYIDGLITLENAIDDIKKNTKKYAKKQMTWFKKNKNVIWLSPEEIKKIPEILKIWLN